MKLGRPEGSAPVIDTPCPHCGRVLKTRQGLNIHLGKVHDDYPLVEKLCSQCDTLKPLSDFPKVSGTLPVRYRAACYDCKNLSEAKYRAVRPIERTASQRRDRRKSAKNHFGLTLEKYDFYVSEFMKSQDGICPGCKEELIDPRLDHDHETLFVRGLLCRNCNVALGLVKDSVDVLQNLIEYLQLTDIKYRASLTTTDQTPAVEGLPLTT